MPVLMDPAQVLAGYARGERHGLWLAAGGQVPILMDRCAGCNRLERTQPGRQRNFLAEIVLESAALLPATVYYVSGIHQHGPLCGKIPIRAAPGSAEEEEDACCAAAGGAATSAAVTFAAGVDLGRAVLLDRLNCSTDTG